MRKLGQNVELLVLVEVLSRETASSKSSCCRAPATCWPACPQAPDRAPFVELGQHRGLEVLAQRSDERRRAAPDAAVRSGRRGRLHATERQLRALWRRRFRPWRGDGMQEFGAVAASSRSSTSPAASFVGLSRCIRFCRSPCPDHGPARRMKRGDSLRSRVLGDRWFRGYRRGRGHTDPLKRDGSEQRPRLAQPPALVYSLLSGILRGAGRPVFAEEQLIQRWLYGAAAWTSHHSPTELSTSCCRPRREARRRRGPAELGAVAARLVTPRRACKARRKPHAVGRRPEFPIKGVGFGRRPFFLYRLAWIKQFSLSRRLFAMSSSGGRSRRLIPEPRLNFWRVTYGNFTDMAVIDWCKPFGSDSEPETLFKRARRTGPV